MASAGGERDGHGRKRTGNSSALAKGMLCMITSAALSTANGTVLK